MSTTLAAAPADTIYKELSHDRVISKAHDAPTDADMALINSGLFARKALQPEDVFTAECLIANTRLDRDNERFTPALLSRFARLLPGRPLFLDHTKSGRGRGKIFRASTETESDGTTWLAGAFYIPRRPHHAELIADVEDGLVSDVSLGFRAPRLITKEPGAGGRSVAEYVDDEGAEPLEVSLVWVGSQHGARVKAAPEPELEDVGELSLLGATYKVAGGVPSDFRMALKAFERELKRARAVQDVLDVDNVEDAERLKMLAEAGLAERKDLEDEVVKFASILGTVKGSQEIREYRKMLQGADRATLITQRERLRGKIAKTNILDSTASGDGKDAGPGKERPVLASHFSV